MPGVVLRGEGHGQEREHVYGGRPRAGRSPVQDDWPCSGLVLPEKHVVQVQIPVYYGTGRAPQVRRDRPE
jgi:hypothetical protein